MCLAPVDYEAVNQTLTFDGDNSRRVIQVSIVDDSVDEDEEVFVSRLFLESAAGEVHYSNQTNSHPAVPSIEKILTTTLVDSSPATPTSMKPSLALMQCS